MDFLLAIVRFMALFSSLLIFAFPSKVKITDLHAYIRDEHLLLNVTLLHGFPQELDELILSGTKVTLMFKVNLFQEEEKKREFEVIHQVKYDMRKRVFLVFLSERDIEMETHDLKLVHKWMSELRDVKVLPKAEIDFGKECLLVVEAALEPIEMKGERFQLMALWRNVKPKASRKISFD